MSRRHNIVVSGDRVWLTSDHHFGHSAIIQFASRPYVTVAEMDNDLISRWNSVVGPEDIVYHLVDFSFHNPSLYANKLRGKILFVGAITIEPTYCAKSDQ